MSSSAALTDSLAGRVCIPGRVNKLHSTPIESEIEISVSSGGWRGFVGQREAGAGEVKR